MRRKQSQRSRAATGTARASGAKAAQSHGCTYVCILSSEATVRVSRPRLLVLPEATILAVSTGHCRAAGCCDASGTSEVNQQKQIRRGSGISTPREAYGAELRQNLQRNVSYSMKSPPGGEILWTSGQSVKGPPASAKPVPGSSIELIYFSYNENTCLVPGSWSRH